MLHLVNVNVFTKSLKNISDVINELVTHDITQHVSLSPYQIKNSKKDVLFLFQILLSKNRSHLEITSCMEIFKNNRNIFYGILSYTMFKSHKIYQSIINL